MSKDTGIAPLPEYDPANTLAQVESWRRDVNLIVRVCNTHLGPLQFCGERWAISRDAEALIARLDGLIERLRDG